MNTLVDFQLQQLVVPGADLGTRGPHVFISHLSGENLTSSQFRNSHVVKTNVMFTTHDWEWSIQPIKIVIWRMVYGMCFTHMTFVFWRRNSKKQCVAQHESCCPTFVSFNGGTQTPLHLLIHSTSIHSASPAMAGWWLTYTPLKNHRLRQLG